MLLFTLFENPLGGFDCRRVSQKISQHQKRWKPLKSSTGLLQSKQTDQGSIKVEHFVDRWFLWRGVINYDLVSGSSKEIFRVGQGVTAGAQN